MWAAYANKPVDQDAIKLEFFRRVHRINPPFRYKVKLGTRRRVAVPEMVKSHYKTPVSLLPSLRDVLRLNTVMTRDFVDLIKQEVIEPEEMKVEDPHEGEDPSSEIVTPREEKQEEGEIARVSNGVGMENTAFQLTKDEDSFLEQVLRENENKQRLKDRDQIKMVEREHVEIKTEIKQENGEVMERVQQVNGCDYLGDTNELMERKYLP